MPRDTNHEHTPFGIGGRPNVYTVMGGQWTYGPPIINLIASTHTPVGHPKTSRKVNVRPHKLRPAALEH